MVSLSARVTTRKKRRPSSGRAAQKRKRLCSCGSLRTGFRTTQIHISLLMYGRRAETLSSKYCVNRKSAIRIERWFRKTDSPQAWTVCVTDWPRFRGRQHQDKSRSPPTTRSGRIARCASFERIPRPPAEQIPRGRKTIELRKQMRGGRAHWRKIKQCISQ
jgi:hypothetical protein